MNAQSDPDLEFLSGSSVRATVLERLASGPARPADLVDRADVSRTTVHRTLSELCERNWARRVEDGYVATAVGERALATYRRARDRFHILRRFEPFLSHVDPDDVGFDLAWLETARIETATETAPQRPFEWYADRLAAIDGDGLRGATPVMNRATMHAHGSIAASEPTALVLGADTFESVRDRYPRQLREALALEEFRLYVAEETPSIGLTLYGEGAFLGAYDERRQLVAVLEGDDDRLVEWAETRFERLRSGARRVSSDAVASPE